jgi:hypothetical protein
MLAFYTSTSEILVALEPSDAKWLGEEMSFLAELYRSKAANSERQFGEHNNVALASFWETALKCQQLSVALHQAVRRGHRREDAGHQSDQHVGASLAISTPHKALASSGVPAIASGSAERATQPKRVRQMAKPRAQKKRKRLKHQRRTGSLKLSVPPLVDCQHPEPHSPGRCISHRPKREKSRHAVGAGALKLALSGRFFRWRVAG